MTPLTAFGDVVVSAVIGLVGIWGYRRSHPWNDGRHDNITILRSYTVGTATAIAGVFAAFTTFTYPFLGVGGSELVGLGAGTLSVVAFMYAIRLTLERERRKANVTETHVID